MDLREKLSLVGICLNGLIAGLIYSVANFMVYVTSYFINEGRPLTSLETELLYFIPYGVSCVTIIPGIWLSHKYPPKMYAINRIALTGSFLVAVSHLLVAICDSPPVIILFYGAIFGLSTGLSITGNISLALAALPDNPRLASGIIACLIGTGSLLFNFIGTLVINPHNYSPDKSFGEMKIFDEKVSSQMPLMFEVIFFICIGIVILCIFLVTNYPPQKKETYKKTIFENRTHEFGVLLFCFSLTTIGPIYVVQKYKDIAVHLQIMSDQWLAGLGSFGALLLSFSELLYGYMSDKYGFNLVYSVIIGQILLLGIGINYGSDISYAFVLYVCLGYISLGGHFSVMKYICSKFFGEIMGMVKVWTAIYSCIGIGTLIAFLVQISDSDISQYASIITGVCSLTLLPLILLVMFNEDAIFEENSVLLLNKDNSKA